MNLYKEAEGYIEDVKLPIADKKALIMLMSSFAECTFNKIIEANNQSGGAVVGRKGGLECPNGCNPSYFENVDYGRAPYCGNCRTWIDKTTIKEFGYLRYRK